MTASVLSLRCSFWVIPPCEVCCTAAVPAVHVVDQLVAPIHRTRAGNSQHAQVASRYSIIAISECLDRPACKLLVSSSTAFITTTRVTCLSLSLSVYSRAPLCCLAQPVNTPQPYLDVARKLGNLLADGGHTCVNGAGRVRFICVVCLVHDREKPSSGRQGGILRIRIA